MRTALIREGKPDLFAVSRDQLALKRTANALSGQFARTAEPGSYNGVVTVSGKSPDSDTRFFRKQLVSVLVS